MDKKNGNQKSIVMAGSVFYMKVFINHGEHRVCHKAHWYSCRRDCPPPGGQVITHDPSYVLTSTQVSKTSFLGMR